MTLALARAGARVFSVYAHDGEAARDLERAAGGAVEAVCADLREPAACVETVEYVVQKAQGLHVLVNCAGGGPDRLLLRATPEYVAETLALNLGSAIHVSRAALQPMLRQRYGRIVSLSSVVAAAGNPGQSIYGAAKAGIEGFTRSLAREVAAKGVTANCVAPGWIETDLTARVADGARERVVASTPVGRAGSADEVARAVLFLAAESSSFLTGTVLQVNGGLYM